MCMEVLICSLDPGFVWFVLACKNLDLDYKKNPTPSSQQENAKGIKLKLKKLGEEVKQGQRINPLLVSLN